MKEISASKVDIMKHAWGFNSSQPGFREHYCTDITNKEILELVFEGYFTGPHYNGNFGEYCGMFYLTTKAKEYLRLMKSMDSKNIK